MAREKNVKSINTEQRIEEVVKFLTKGKKRSWIIAEKGKEWGVSNRQIETYITEARKLIKQNMAEIDEDYLLNLYDGLLEEADEQKNTFLKKLIVDSMAKFKKDNTVNVNHSGNIDTKITIQIVGDDQD